MSRNSKFKAGLIRFASLNDQQWELLLKLLRSQDSGASEDNLPIPGITSEGLGEVLGFLASLPLLFDTPEKAKVAALKRAGDLASEQLANRLTSALDTPFVALATKTQYLTSFHQRFFIESEIVTDVRAVFGGVDDLEPQAWIPYHNLKLTFMEQGDRKELFLSLEPGDLVNLSEQLERARAKQQVLFERFYGGR